jgi:hypothetical protein
MKIASTLAVTATFLLSASASALESGFPMAVPTATVLDSDTPPNAVGPADISSATSVKVTLLHNDCPVVLTVADGVLRNGQYFTTTACTGTAYARAPNGLASSPFGANCGVPAVNADNEVYMLTNNLNVGSVTLRSRYNGTSCDLWSAPDGEMWPGNSIPEGQFIGDLDTLFVPPFSVQLN